MFAVDQKLCRLLSMLYNWDPIRCPCCLPMVTLRCGPPLDHEIVFSDFVVLLNQYKSKGHGKYFWAKMAKQQLML